MERKQLVYRSATVTVHYRPDRRSIARCAVGPELHREVHRIVDTIAKPYAESVAPRRTGHYAKSFEVKTAYVAMGDPELMTRVAARLWNMDEAAAAIEWGAHGRRGAHVLGQTLTMLDRRRAWQEVALEDAFHGSHAPESDGGE
jgi:hypothetical protein